MNQAQWHLALNHLPVTGALFSVIVLFAGVLIKNSSVRKTGLWLFILTGLSSIAALLTGEGAEEVLEAIGKNPHFLTEAHEELAEKAFWFAQLIAVLSLINLAVLENKLRLNRIFSFIILIGGVILVVMMTKVADLGGEIRHTEIRKSAPDTNDLSPGMED
jgi:hypothetical protein